VPYTVLTFPHQSMFVTFSVAMLALGLGHHGNHLFWKWGDE